jgi:hypothetical protein
MNKVSEVAVLSVLIQTYIWIWELHKTQLTWGGGMGPPVTNYSNRTHCRVGSRPSRTTVWMWLQCLFCSHTHYNSTSHLSSPTVSFTVKVLHLRSARCLRTSYQTFQWTSPYSAVFGRSQFQISDRRQPVLRFCDVFLSFSREMPGRCFKLRKLIRLIQRLRYTATRDQALLINHTINEWMNEWTRNNTPCTKLLHTKLQYYTLPHQIPNYVPV